MKQRDDIKNAKSWIKDKPMPAGLEMGFRKNGWYDWLDKVYQRTAELVSENADKPDAVIRHLKQILPCIAFYEILLEKEADQEQALAIFEKYCFTKIRKMAKALPVIMKIPGLYQKVPGIMNKMVDSTFGPAAGFEGVPVDCKDGFAMDMVKCPYVETCKKYGCPELAPVSYTHLTLPTMAVV